MRAKKTNARVKMYVFVCTCVCMTTAGELQLRCGPGENYSQIFTGGHWRPRSQRWEPHPDPGSGLAVNEKVESPLV